MNINKFTEKAREAVAKAIDLAKQGNNPQVEPEHLLVALVEQADGIVPELLRKMNIQVPAVASGARDLLKNMPQAYGGSEPRLSPRFSLVTDRAQVEAERVKDEYVSTEHLFIAIADEGGRSPAAQHLKKHGISQDAVAQALKSIRGSQRVTTENPEGTYQALERVWPRFDRPGAPRQARPGHRPRRRDPSRDSGALAAHEKQPGADWRARRRQDRDCRRSRRPHFPR